MKSEPIRRRDPDLRQASARKWLAFVAIGSGALISTLDVSIVNVSLPTMVEQLQTDFATIQWVILSYVLVITSMMMGVARLGDMYGKKKLYIIGMGVFTFASLLCGLSPNVGWLIGFRGFQGCGAVMMQALMAALITEIFPAHERGRALGAMGSIVSVGLALGPAIGGILIGTVGWRSIFLINVPVGIAGALATWRLVPRSRNLRPEQRFDFTGAAVLFFSLGGYALGMTLGQRLGFDYWPVLVLLAGAGSGLAAFIACEARTVQPMINLRLFKNVLFSLNLIMSLMVFMFMAGVFIFPFYLELVLGYKTQEVGLIMMTVPVVMGLVAPAAGSLSDRFGVRGITLLGLVVVAAGCLSIGTLHKGVSTLGYILRVAPLGLGMGLFVSPNNSAIMGAAPKDQLGVASGLLALTRTLGQTSGIPLIGVIFTAQVLAAGGLNFFSNPALVPAEALVKGVNGTYHLAAMVVAAATILAAVAMWLDWRRRKLNKVSLERPAKKTVE